ncbi:bifunctional acetaldehyde-CoA/alcohol dehydrogenase [Streptomyces scabiei]
MNPDELIHRWSAYAVSIVVFMSSAAARMFVVVQSRSDAGASAVECPREAVGIEPSFRALGVDEHAFLDALPQQALSAYEDQCAPADPRMPMLDDMQEILRTAYHGPANTPSA